jgi:hypothetical protein
MRWNVLPRPPYSTDLASSDFHLFGPLKDALRGRRLADDDELNHSVKTSDGSAKSFTRPTYSVSRKGGKSALVMKKTLWKNNLDFVKDVPVIYVSFIIIAIIVSEKKIGDIAFVPPVI